jgi:hypothetical protein
MLGARSLSSRKLTQGVTMTTSPCEGPWELDLLTHWQLRLAGKPVQVAFRQQRILAALALLGSRPRQVLAGLQREATR